MTVAEELAALTEDFQKKFLDLEKKWTDRHQRAQDVCDRICRAPIAPLDGLIEFLTRGLDESFEERRAQLEAEFDVRAEQIVMRSE